MSKNPCVQAWRDMERVERELDANDSVRSGLEVEGLKAATQFEECMGKQQEMLVGMRLRQKPIRPRWWRWKFAGANAAFLLLCITGSCGLWSNVAPAPDLEPMPVPEPLMVPVLIESASERWIREALLPGAASDNWLPPQAEAAQAAVDADRLAREGME